jgi:hypothetical protein
LEAEKAITLEERISALESDVEQLKHTTRQNDSNREVPWWETIHGTFKDDPVYDAIVRLGEEWRQSQPIPEDESAHGDGEHLSS